MPSSSNGTSHKKLGVSSISLLGRNVNTYCPIMLLVSFVYDLLDFLFIAFNIVFLNEL